MPFAYLRDPLFLACVAAYLVNRFVLKAIWADGFVHEHFNDLICIGFCVPPMLFAARRLGLRRHDRPPDTVEIVVPLVVWSLVFEIWLPTTETFSPWAVADHRDVLWYAVGGLSASAFWTWRYAPCGQKLTNAALAAGEPAANISVAAKEKLT